MKRILMSSLFVIGISVSEKYLVDVLDARDASSAWGVEHRIGVEMLELGSLQYALQAFSRSAIVLPYPKESYPDVLNRYYQLACKFLLKDHKSAIYLGEGLLSSIKNKGNQQKYPFYRDVLVTMVLLYDKIHSYEKKKVMLNELGILSPFSANKIQEREKIRSINTLGLISTLKESGDEKSCAVARDIEVYGDNLVWKSIFPEYAFYVQGNKVISSLFLVMDFIVALPLIWRKPEVIQTAIAAGVIRIIASFRIIRHFRDNVFIKRRTAIECILEQRGLTNRQLIGIDSVKHKV